MLVCVDGYRVRWCCRHNRHALPRRQIIETIEGQGHEGRRANDHRPVEVPRAIDLAVRIMRIPLPLRSAPQGGRSNCKWDVIVALQRLPPMRNEHVSEPC